MCACSVCSSTISGLTELNILLNSSNLDFVNPLAFHWMHLIVVVFILGRFLGILVVFIIHIFIPGWGRGEHWANGVVP